MGFLKASHKFGMYGPVYGRHKICKFDINWPSNYSDTRDANGDKMFPVNNTFVCYASLLTTEA